MKIDQQMQEGELYARVLNRSSWNFNNKCRMSYYILKSQKIRTSKIQHGGHHLENRISAVDSVKVVDHHQILTANAEQLLVWEKLGRINYWKIQDGCGRSFENRKSAITAAEFHDLHEISSLNAEWLALFEKNVIFIIRNQIWPYPLFWKSKTNYHSCRTSPIFMKLHQ